MDITFHIPGMPFNGDTLSSDRSLGGSETMAALLAEELGARGHRLHVFGTTPQEGVWGNVVYRNMGQSDQRTPFGAQFHHYAQHVPSDILLMQRLPAAFHYKYASKVNLWWTHDLALKRHLPQMSAQLWNIDRVLAVSQWHKEQVAGVYQITPERIGVLPNGLDLGRFRSKPDAAGKIRGKKVLYSSRPERGLENYLVIAEKMLSIDPSITFFVCGYDNTTPEMQQYYEFLWGRAQGLQNVVVLGPQPQSKLAALMQECWLHVYPTAFEETSCITAMEEQAAGTPFVTSKVGALPETLEDAGVWWVNGSNPEDYVKAILYLKEHPDKWSKLHQAALRKAPQYGISRAAAAFEAHCEEIFQAGTKQRSRMSAHFMRHSDIWELEPNLREPEDGIERRLKDELDTCYQFALKNEFAEHYRRYYQREGEKNPAYYKVADISGQPRLEATVVELKKMGLPEGALVVDYGCGHGDFIVTLAQRFPRLRFLGVDLAEFNLQIAENWRSQQSPEEQERVQFRQCSQEGIADLPEADCIIAEEVLEHINDPVETADRLGKRLKEGGWLLLSTPFGPWEALGYLQEWPLRAHLWHFEAHDLRAMFGHHGGFQLGVVPVEFRGNDARLGSYIVVYQKPTEPSKGGNPITKRQMQNPQETLSVCMIVKGDGIGLERTLQSVQGIADEIRLFIDGPGHAWDIGKRFRAECVEAESPLKIGFDEARNRSIEGASGDWIMWIDSDEELLHAERLRKYLRPNHYSAYAIHHDHVSGEPAGLLKTDLPCRLFRNRIGFRFHGLVHEHPEIGKMNSGAGHVLLIPRNDAAIFHAGYSSEEVRRKRFQRNWPLMERDHKENPERLLGQFLYLRDLCHLNRFDRELYGGITPEMAQRAGEGVAVWRKQLQGSIARQGEKRPEDRHPTQMLLDGLPYYSECVEIVTNGGGLLFGCSVAANILGVGDRLDQEVPPPVMGRFMDRSDAESLLALMVKEKLDPLGGKYL